jgi:hypothetical protein
MRKASDVFSNECVDRLKILEEDKEWGVWKSCIWN